MLPQSNIRSVQYRSAKYDCFQMNEAEKFLGELSAEVQSRLRNINRKGKTITLKLKVRHQDAPKVTAKFMGG